MTRYTPIACAVLLAACGGNTVQNTATPDAGFDAARFDVTDDAQSPDVAPPDTSLDVPSRPDATPPVDATPNRDATPALDAPQPSLLGRWRVTRWEYTPAGGDTIALTDRNTDIDTGTGEPAPFRINGALTLAPSRLDLSFGTLGSDHFYLYPMPTTPEADYSATGFSLVGLWRDDDATFSLPGGGFTFRLTRNADGTLSLASMESGERSVTTFARQPLERGPATLNLYAAAQLRAPDRSLPFRHARASLAWENPAGPAAAPIETARAALTFRMGYAGFPVVFAGGPPAEVIARVAGVEVAVAVPFVYDDLDDNGRYDAASGDGGAGDDRRGYGPLVLVWRGEGTPGAAWAESAFASVVPGWQIAHASRINGEGDWALQPFDPTVMPSPDVPVSPTALRDAPPRFLR